MERTVEIGSYAPESGLALKWLSGYALEVRVHGTEVTLRGNAAGLRSLAQHLLTLAEETVPDGVHVHLEPGLELEDLSESLVLDRMPSE